MGSIPLSGSIGVPGNVFILGNTNVVFATDANHLLTSTEYTNQFLEVTGTISTTRQLIAPLTQGQVFIVQNNVSDGYSITIGGSSGAIVTITNGETLSVVCDGTNYLGTTGTSFVAGGDLTGSNTDQTVVSLTGSSGTVSVIAETLKFANTVSTAVIDQAALASTSSSSGATGAT